MSRDPDVMLYFIDSAQNSKKFYEMSLDYDKSNRKTPWSLYRTWGRLTFKQFPHNAEETDYFRTEAEARETMEAIRQDKLRKGYIQTTQSKGYPVESLQEKTPFTLDVKPFDVPIFDYDEVRDKEVQIGTATIVKIIVSELYVDDQIGYIKAVYQIPRSLSGYYPDADNDFVYKAVTRALNAAGYEGKVLGRGDLLLQGRNYLYLDIDPRMVKSIAEQWE